MPVSYLLVLEYDASNVDDNSNTINTAWPIEEAAQGQPSPLKFDENSVWNNNENTINNNDIIQESMPAILTPPPELNTEKESEQPETNEFYVRALYDFNASNDEEISFKAEELIKIVDKESDDGWWTGINAQGQKGHFPSMLVYLLEDNDEDEMNNDSESENSNTDDDSDNELENGDIDIIAKVPPVPPLPPLPAPTITGPDNGKNVESNADIQLSIVEPSINDETVMNGNGNTAPAPKTMNLMAPQSVVIIQPTPEIEFRPTIGSEQKEVELMECENSINNQTSNNLEKKKKITDNNINNNNNTSINRIEQNIGVSMAIAVHEISETIAQQTLDDSLKEFERRQSSSSNSSALIDASSGANTSVSNNIGETGNTMLNNLINDNNNDEEDNDVVDDVDDDDVK